MIATNTPEFLSYINSLSPGARVMLCCPHCQNSFVRTKNVIQSKFGKHNKLKTIYCSLRCFGDSRVVQQPVECKQCFSKFLKRADQIKKSPNHFCTRSCAATYNNTHKTKGTRRSKLEVWLETKLRELFPLLVIEFNNKTHIGSELDILFVDLNLAVELNGIFHYEPIYGKDKLDKIQTNDDCKMQKCIQEGIELCIIDTSSLTYFKEARAQKFLDIILSLLKEKGVNSRSA